MLLLFTDIGSAWSVPVMASSDPPSTERLNSKESHYSDYNSEDYMDDYDDDDYYNEEMEVSTTVKHHGNYERGDLFILQTSQFHG